MLQGIGCRSDKTSDGLLINQKHFAKFRLPLQNIHAGFEFCCLSLSKNVTLKCEVLGIIWEGEEGWLNGWLSHHLYDSLYDSQRIIYFYTFNNTWDVTRINIAVTLTP